MIKPNKKEIAEFLDNWGQTDKQITTALGMEDNIWLKEYRKMGS